MRRGRGNKSYAVRVRAKVGAVHLEDDGAIDQYVTGLLVNAAMKIGPHLAEVAKARAPVRRPGRKDRPHLADDRDYAPQSFQRVQLRPESQFQGSAAYEKFVLHPSGALKTRASLIRQLKKAGGETRSPSVTQFFQGTRKGGTLGKSPDVIRVKGNTLQGAFKGGRGGTGGTLRDSIRFDGVSVEGGQVVARVTAHAPYALYVHEGFQHKGGTRIAGRPFLASALVNIKDRLTDASTYEG